MVGSGAPSRPDVPRQRGDLEIATAGEGWQIGSMRRTCPLQLAVSLILSPFHVPPVSAGRPEPRYSFRLYLGEVPLIRIPTSLSVRLGILAAVFAVGAYAFTPSADTAKNSAAGPLDTVLRIFALGSERGSSIDRRLASGPPPAVTVSKPAARVVTDWDEYTGRFEASASVEVRARVAGYLDQVNFKDGQVVAKGDLLYTIDRRPFEAAVAQANAELSQALTKVESAAKDVDRGRPLVATKVMSEKTFDDRSNVKREAESAVKVAEAKLRTSELDLAFTLITAPISGRMSRSLITPGNYVSGGGAAQPTLLTTIVSQDPIHLYFDISEANAIKYRRLSLDGAKAGAGEAGAIVEIGLPDEKGFPHRGTIDFSDNRLDASTGTLRMRASVENAKGLYSPGLFARVRVAGSSAYQALLLPDEAIGTDQANKFVLVVADDSTVQRRVVVQGPLAQGLRVVKSGLKSEEWVVIKGLQRARPGQKVAPTREVLQVTEAATSANAQRPGTAQ